MFVIYDSKANAYMQPWFLTNEPMAMRAFGDLINDPESNAGKHPEDYTLFKIGTFNDTTAEVDWTSPVTLGNGIQYKKQDEEQPDLFFDKLGINEAAQLGLVEPTDSHEQNRQHMENLAANGDDQ